MAMSYRPVFPPALLLAAFVASGCSPEAVRSPAPSPGAAATAAGEDVRVMVYNIHAGKTAAGAPNLRDVAALIRARDADLVLLQEVDRGTERSGGVDQLAELERLTGLRGAFGRTLDYQGGEYGIAVLSRWPILSDTLIPLPIEPAQERAGGSYEPRGAQRVRVDAPGGAIGVLNTHLDASGDDRYRRQEVVTVLREAAALRANHPRTVVGGDFNAEPGSAVVGAMLEAGWSDAWRECGDGGLGHTFPADEPVKRIDYVFLSPALTCQATTVLSTPASDHRPLLVAAATPRPDPALSSAGRAWVEETLGSLTVREKAGQLVMPWVGGEYVATDSPEFDRLLEWVETHGVGGLVLSMGLPHSYAAKLNALQRRAHVPLLIAADMENGPGMRMSGIYSLPHLLPQGGGTAFPPVMGFGAAGSERLAFELGRVLGREARAVGVHVVFGPVMDVNSNPANPIINTRSFGEDPQRVGRLGAAYIRGARIAGLMTTAKHFPGHGDTSEDSHIELPAITADRARMDSIELPPFRAAIEAGVDGVMTAHIAVTGVLGPDAPPATLSRHFMTGVLREEMGFGGLLYTDAMTMGGVVEEYGGGAEVLIRAIEAGADVLLMPADVGAAVEAITTAVEGGRLGPGRLDASVRRILEAKVRAGLDVEREVDLEAVDDIVGIRAHTNLAREVAERAITLARDRTGLLPLADSARVLVVSYIDRANPAAGRAFVRTLAARRDVRVAWVDDRTSTDEWEELRARADAADIVVAAAQVTPRENVGSVDAGAGFTGFVEDLAALGRPVVAVSFGSPYLLHAFPSVPTYLLAWGGADVSQHAAARALLGEIAINGRLPVSLPPHYPVGAGIQRPPPPAGQ
ncbi:MAG TPA: glycoside hydrolase family 3 N-terminal domain-containing protein [Longimicrobiales bacterium]|nr:glycoside hydrolase family 3 N-terminal domain-containing protein [Longimicrobiales bacterium]